MGKTLTKLNYWKLAIWKGISGSLLILGAAAPSAILNWSSMSGEGRTVAVIGLFVGVIKYLDAFVDQTISRLAEGKPPVRIGREENGGPPSPTGPPIPA